MYRIPNNLREQIVINDNNCWIWTGKKDPNGYGYFYSIEDHRIYYIHRYIYELFKGKIIEIYPKNILDHIICNNPPCCNPEHLIVTCLGKNGSRWRKEKTHCKYGHKYVVRKGKRYCKICEHNYDLKRNGIRHWLR